MNKNIQKNVNVGAIINRPQNKGITLIVLVITIIILIILSGVAISMTLGQNGIFNKTKDAEEKYTVAQIKEKVELEITNLEIDRIDTTTTLTIEEALQEMVENGTFESIDKEAQIGNIGEYEVKLKYNENNKVIIEYIEKATGVRATYTLDPVGYTNIPKVDILFKTQGKVKSIIKPDGLIIYPEKDIVAIDYQVTANESYKFIVEDIEGNKKEKNVIVDTIDTLPPKDFKITAENTGEGFIITANAEDAEVTDVSVCSGIEKIEYYVKKESEIDYTKYDTNEIKGLKVGKYNIYVVAYDKARNSKQSSTITAEVKLIVKFNKVSVGADSTMGIDTKGKLWGWGKNDFGEVGIGKGMVKLPIQIKNDVDFKEVAVGAYFTLAIDVEGDIWSWGSAMSGVLGNGRSDNNIYSPQKISIENNTKFKAVAVGNIHSLAIDEEGNIWVWGSNSGGRLGNGVNDNATVYSPQKLNIENDIKFKKIVAGADYTLAIDVEGNIWACGSSYRGDTDNQYNLEKMKINNTIKFTDVETKTLTNIALDVNGNIYTWGYNDKGQLGDGTTTKSYTPKKMNVDGNILFDKISVGNSQCFAIDKSGNLWSWGAGYYGDGSYDNSYIPKKVEMKNNIKIEYIDQGTSHNIIIDDQQELWIWGSNSSGQIGDGTMVGVSVPKKIF